MNTDGASERLGADKAPADPSVALSPKFGRATYRTCRAVGATAVVRDVLRPLFSLFGRWRPPLLARRGRVRATRLPGTSEPLGRSQPIACCAA